MKTSKVSDSQITIEKQEMKDVAMYNNMCGQCKRLASRLKKFLIYEFVFCPTSKWHFRWLLLVSLCFLYNTIFIIARTVFWNLQESNPALWMLVDYSCDLLYLTDMYLRIKTAYYVQGILVSDPKLMLRMYMGNVHFFMDLVSLLPTDFLYIFYGTGLVIVRINRLLRFHRLNEFLYKWETKSAYPNLVRIFTLTLYILIIIHFNACIFFQFSAWLGLGSDNWVYPSVQEYDDDGNFNVRSKFTHMYFFCYFWATLTLSTIGDLPVPERDEEYLFMIFNFMVGILVFVTIVGQVGALLTNMNASRTDFQAKLDAVKNYMEVRKVEKVLENKVVKWFDYLNSNKHSLEGESALSVLSAKLKADIAINVHLETLKKVPIFKNCETGLLVELVLKLKQRVYSPLDFVCRKGDIGKEMYIIKTGKLQVVSEDGSQVFATLSEGTVFGEISVLNIAGNKNGNRRTASIRSVGYSELFVLEKDDLWMAMEEYSEAKVMLIEKGRQMLRRDNLLDEEVSKKQEINVISFDSQLQQIEAACHMVTIKMKKMVTLAKWVEEEVVEVVMWVEKEFEALKYLMKKY